jgi:hypothetical protein
MSIYLLLAPLAAIALFVAFLRLFHAGSRIRCRLLEKDDLIFRKICRSGVPGALRRVYRAVPSNPRCRFCLVPFGGVGKVFGFAPSRKNPNFCPG